MSTELLHRSIPDLAEGVRRGEISAVELTERSLARIAARDAELGAFLTVSAEQALDAARRIDERRARGEALGPLAGVPIGVKDALCTHDAPTTAASRILLSSRRAPAGAGTPADGYRPPYDATVVARLRAADAVIVGKCNLDEFAMGSSTENSAFFPARNPWDPTRTPGGSSGGSAVAVAARMAAGALGSDTGGSIRQPAGLTGTVGIKPTYGRVSRYGLMAFASSLDQVGTFAADVRSAARVLDVIAGHDPHDATSLSAPVSPSESGSDDVRGLRVGVPEEYFAEGLDPEIERSVRAAIDALVQLGATAVPVRLPHTRFAVATYYVIATAEASSNLARYDGVRFGARARPAGASSLRELYEQTRGEGFGAEVKRRILLGTYVLSAGYYDAYYLRAQRARTLFIRDFEETFRAVDVIATPVSPTPAFKLGERTQDPLAMYLADVYTLPASLAGLPALSLPCGMTEATPDRPRLPIGLQLIAPPLAEPRLIGVAAAFEAGSAVRGLSPPETAPEGAR